MHWVKKLLITKKYGGIIEPEYMKQYSVNHRIS